MIFIPPLAKKIGNIGNIGNGNIGNRLWSERQILIDGYRSCGISLLSVR